MANLRGWFATRIAFSDLKSTYLFHCNRLRRFKYAMSVAPMSPFFDTLLQRHEQWRELPLIERVGSGWRGTALTVPSPPEADLSAGLDIEEVGGEITVSLDHSHVHIEWPPLPSRAGDLWGDPIVVIDAIVSEKVLAASGWIDGRLRVGSLREVGGTLDLIVPNLQRLRVRSWRGTFDRDEVLVHND